VRTAFSPLLERFPRQILLAQRQLIAHGQMGSDPAPRWFCRTLNDGRPSSPYAMISPSMTVSSGSASSARPIELRRLVKSLPLREREESDLAVGLQTERAIAIDFSSYDQTGPFGSLVTARASIGSMNPTLALAILTIRA
jgi:hypothetical protein